MRLTLTVGATMFASSAYTFDPAELQKLNVTNAYSLCDLTRANLFSAHLNVWVTGVTLIQ